jgi:hypothetical protein
VRHGGGHLVYFRRSGFKLIARLSMFQGETAHRSVDVRYFR